MSKEKEKEKAIPTQEEYISEQIAVKRNTALNKSRNRISVRVPMLPNQETEEEWKNRIDGHIELVKNNIKLTKEGFGKITALYNNSDTTFQKRVIQKEQNHLDELLKEKDRGYPTMVAGANCMYNAGDCYGLNIPGNQTFAVKYKEKGFKRVDSSNMEPGDIVQDVNHNGIPKHAMIFDGKDKDGKALYNYARGSYSGIFDKDYVKQGRYPMEYDPLVYRYVGTPADSTQWINQYKQIYGLDKGGIIGIPF